MQEFIINLLDAISIVAIGGAYYIWQELIKVPDEYTKASAE